MSDAGHTAVGPNAGSRQIQLNPERAPALIAKYQKMLGKEIDKISVEYTSTGVNVWVTGLHEDFVKKNANGSAIRYPIAELKAIKQEAAKPSDEEALRAFINKFEVRLNLPFPENSGLTSASDEQIQAFLAGRPFNQRRAMLMSNKQFKSAYPNGFA